MKSLNSIPMTRLTVIKFGEFVKETLRTVDALGVITEPFAKAYHDRLLTESDTYQLAMVNHAKSDETAKIAAADTARDLALSAFFRQLSVYELSDNSNELDSYNSLKNMITNYDGIIRADYAQETGMIDNLVVDLNSSKHAAHISALNMDSLVSRMDIANNNFKALFLGRSQEAIGVVKYDVKDLRKKMKIAYELFANYILTLSQAENTPIWNHLLDAVNVVRKYYSDELAKMNGGPTASTPVL